MRGQRFGLTGEDTDPGYSRERVPGSSPGKTGRIVLVIVAAAFGAYNLFFAWLQTDSPRSTAGRIWLLLFAALAAGYVVIILAKKNYRTSRMVLLLGGMFLSWVVLSYLFKILSLL